MANAKIYVLLYSFCFVLFWIWGQFPSPGGLVFGGAIYRTFFCVMSLGGLYLEQFIHGVAYFQNFTVFHICNCTLAYLSRDQIYRHLYRQKFISIVIQALLILYSSSCLKDTNYFLQFLQLYHYYRDISIMWTLRSAPWGEHLQKTLGHPGPLWE